MFAAVRFSIEEDSAALSSHRPPPFHIFGKNASIRLGKHKQPKSKEAQTVSLCWTKTKQKTNYKLKTTTTTLETHQKKLSNTHKAELFKISICNFSIFSLCSQHGLCVCVFFSSHFDFLFGSQLMRTFSVFLLVVQLTFSFLSLSQKTHFVCGANAFLFFTRLYFVFFFRLQYFFLFSLLLLGLFSFSHLLSRHTQWLCLLLVYLLFLHSSSFSLYFQFTCLFAFCSRTYSNTHRNVCCECMRIHEELCVCSA